jgi:hypothetical protein
VIAGLMPPPTDLKTSQPGEPTPAFVHAHRAVWRLSSPYPHRIPSSPSPAAASTTRLEPVEDARARREGLDTRLPEYLNTGDAGEARPGTALATSPQKHGTSGSKDGLKDKVSPAENRISAPVPRQAAVVPNQ